MDTQSARDELRQVAKIHPYIYVDRLERMAKAWVEWRVGAEGIPKPEIPHVLEVLFTTIFMEGFDHCPCQTELE